MRLTPQQVFLRSLRRLSRGACRTDGSDSDLLVSQDHEQGRPGRSLRPSLNLPGGAILLGKLRCWGAKLAVRSPFRTVDVSPLPGSDLAGQYRFDLESELAGSGHRRYPRAALGRIAFIVFAPRMV